MKRGPEKYLRRWQIRLIGFRCVSRLFLPEHAIKLKQHLAAFIH
jgi:hypothetical protein